MAACAGAEPGIGMTAEQLSRVFTPFAQANTSTTRRFRRHRVQGTTIARQLVELMQQGTCRSAAFQTKAPALPFACPCRRASPWPPPPCWPAWRCRRCAFWADDMPENLELLQLVLARDEQPGHARPVAAKRRWRCSKPRPLMWCCWICTCPTSTALPSPRSGVPGKPSRAKPYAGDRPVGQRLAAEPPAGV